jgi:hypothetical protein
MTLYWTGDTPSKPGWYFVRMRVGRHTLPYGVTNVYRLHNKLCVSFRVFHAQAVAELTDWEWAGPIPTPRSPRKPANASRRATR